MGETGGTSAPSDFWHCGQCGTPNPARAYLTRCVGCGTRRTRRGEATGKVRPDEVHVTVEPPRTGGGRWIGRASWAYAVFVLLVLVLIRWVGDGWWGVVVLLLMPRWLFLGPLIVLALASALARRPSQWAVQAATALVVAGPLMAVSAPVWRLWTARAEGEPVRVMTLNRGGRLLDAPRLIKALDREAISVVFFQEPMKPNPALEAYFAGWSHDKTRHIYSRFPIVAELPILPEQWASEERYVSSLWRVVVKSPGGTELLLASVHLPTLRFGIKRLRRGEVRAVRLHLAWWRTQLEREIGAIEAAGDRPALIGGDFNLPSDDSSMAALRSRFVDGFLDAGWGYGYTRPADVPWVRIDHVLSSPEIAFRRCWVGPDVGSDHLPLIAEVVLPPAAAPGPAAEQNRKPAPFAGN